MKNIKINKIYFITSLIILTLALGFPSFKVEKVKAENTVAQDEISQTEKELEEIIKQQEALKNELEFQKENQSQLQNDAQYIENVISSKALEVKNLELEGQKIDLELKNNGEKIVEINKRQEEINKDKEKLNDELAEFNNLLYKMSFNTPSILDKKSTFQDTVIGQEKLKAVVRLAKVNISEVEKLEKEAADKKVELASREDDLKRLQNEKVAQGLNLTSQQQALKWQKENKETLAKQSKDKQQDLLKENEDLNQKIAQTTARLNSLRQQAVNTPPSGENLTSGQIIGYEGRTGYVCGYVSPEQLASIPPEDYATSYLYCPAGLYFLPDINKYPLVGAHLHFEYYVNGYAVDPMNYYSQFDTFPMSGAGIGNITQGYHGGHYANDIFGPYGAPIYAVKPGQVQYFCDNIIPGNPGFGAVVTHNDGTKSLYWHLQFNSSTPCLNL